MASILNLEALRKAQVQTDPYPYFVVDHSILTDAVQGVIRDFPPLRDGGSFNLEDVKYGPRFDQFLKNLDTPEFRKILCDKFNVDIMDLPM
ncbi:MAG TPA: hypothetical protein VM553_09610, partial [Dongiaceae bacterium]|nr:hypothetical protein [Dongiaceae bacterium]